MISGCIGQVYARPHVHRIRIDLACGDSACRSHAATVNEPPCTKVKGLGEAAAGAKSSARGTPLNVAAE